MSELPAGTVTFLFTDIEHATRWWERYPAPMQEIVARHDRILQECIAAHSGHYFKNRGSGCCAAFAHAGHALEAAAAIQLALQHENWEPLDGFCVRIALLTGEAAPQNGDYVGTALNRVSRLVDAAYGRQILMSESTWSLVRDDLPAPLAVTSLGSHSLKDLQHAETIYQLTHPDLPADFPPPRSLDAFKHNLPLQVSAFIGREGEIGLVRTLLENTRLLTLSGPGGCGKTRLALQIAADLLEAFDSVYLVELAGLDDGELIPQTVASILGINAEGTRPLTVTLAEHLRSRSLLLVLDNCEHLVEPCARLVEKLLRACPQLTILATSREVLGIAGETAHRVASLAVPDETIKTMEGAGSFEAVQLFMLRAQDALPEFQLADANAGAIGEICRRLDGIPLALELAARRVKAMSPERIAAQLDYCFALLTGGSGTAMERQQTLRATMDWSYNLLSGEERTLLCRLSAFVGGFTLEAAEAVCAVPEGATDDSPFPLYAFDVLDLLMRLVDKSLVQFEAQSDGSGRYRLLETIRQYGMDRLLHEDDQADRWRDRHRAWFLRLAEQARPELRGPDHAQWIRRLEQEHDNLRAALKWATDAETRLRLANGLYGFWYVRGYLSEGRSWLEGALERGGVSPATQAEALSAAGLMALGQGDEDASQRFYEQALAAYETLEDRNGIAKSRNNLGLVAHRRGDYTAMRSHLEACLPLYRELGETAHEMSVLTNLGLAATEQGIYADARFFHEQSLALSERMEDYAVVPDILHNLGELAFREGNHAEARCRFEESLRRRWESKVRRNITISLHSLGMLALVECRYQNAVLLLSVAASTRQQIDAPLPEWEQKQCEAALNELQIHLGEGFAEMWQRGTSLSLEGAVALVLPGIDAPVA